MIRGVHPGSRIRMVTFYPSRIPDSGVKKAPDPGSATPPGSLFRIRIPVQDPSYLNAGSENLRVRTSLRNSQTMYKKTLF